MHIMTPFLRLLEDSPGEIKQCCPSGVSVDLGNVVPFCMLQLSEHAVVLVPL